MRYLARAERRFRLRTPEMHTAESGVAALHHNG
jgi:hypothetical protein